MSFNFDNMQTAEKFSKLSLSQLEDFLRALNNYQIAYRSDIGTSDNATFGLEIEYENCFLHYNIKEMFPGWQSVYDMTLTSGGEIVSPIMINEEKYWNELKKICDLLNENHANTSFNAGGHVHLGTQILGKDPLAWTNFIKIYTLYEHVLFHFGSGDKALLRDNGFYYAKPLASTLYKLLPFFEHTQSIEDLEVFLPKKTKWNAISFCNVLLRLSQGRYPEANNTIEFRFPNGTSNPIIWQNNVNAFIKLLTKCSSKELDTDFLDYKIDRFKPIKKTRYDDIFLKDALEFADLIFENALDKINFLRQYIKDVNDIYGIDDDVIIRKFTK